MGRGAQEGMQCDAVAGSRLRGTVGGVALLCLCEHVKRMWIVVWFVCRNVFAEGEGKGDWDLSLVCCGWQ